MYKPNDCYIDLDLPLPITAEELFDEDDIEFIESDDDALKNPKYSHSFKTTNMSWSIPPTGPSPDGTIGYLTNQDIADELHRYYNEHFTVNALADSLTNYPEPFTIVKFHKSSRWHKEGGNEWHNDIDSREVFKSRFPYAFNFALYGDVEDSSVLFGVPAEELVQEEKYLEQKIVNKHRSRVANGLPFNNSLPISKVTGRRMQARSKKYDFSVYMGRAGFSSDKDESEMITTKLKREGNYGPFIINVGQWHRVITNNMARVTLRFMGGTNYTFNELEDLHANKQLLVQDT